MAARQGGVGQQRVAGSAANTVHQQWTDPMDTAHDYFKRLEAERIEVGDKYTTKKQAMDTANQEIDRSSLLGANRVTKGQHPEIHPTAAHHYQVSTYEKDKREEFQRNNRDAFTPAQNFNRQGYDRGLEREGRRAKNRTNDHRENGFSATSRPPTPERDYQAYIQGLAADNYEPVMKKKGAKRDPRMFANGGR